MTGVELRHIRYLLAVADEGNFTRAAEELRISQPTLSHQIKQLEKHLGAQLIDRSGRNIRLTDAGAVYVEQVRHALRDVQSARRALLDVKDLSRGHLRLGITPTFTTYLMGPLIGKLHELHPGLTVTITEDSQERIESGLLSDELDLGIAFAQVQHLSGVEATGMYTENLGLVASKEHAAALPHPLPAAALGKHSLALLTGDFATRNYIDSCLAKLGISPRISVKANSLQALTQIVEHTSLATVLPDAVAEEGRLLAPVPLDPPFPARTVALLRRQDAYRSAASQAFVELLELHITQRGYQPAV
ncbi:transcriptional regulator CynR [Glutamicibacter sp.]|uniref:transcriptional regulator CynR n=1 Tax=Glutamicibacter sp. TaxID=1931995 RepID=UPI0028BEBD7A|nr:transcriptional regulator CynR [Glutamicibacter sp.]